MPYECTGVTVEAIDKVGTVIYSKQITSLTDVWNTSILARNRVIFNIRPTAGNLYNKVVNINPLLFSDGNINPPPIGSTAGWQCQTSSTNSVYPMSIVSSSFATLNTNLSASLNVVNAFQAELTFEYYVTADVQSYISHSGGNLNRFLAMKINGQYMRQERNTAFTLTDAFTNFVIKVKDVNTPNFEIVIDQAIDAGSNTIRYRTDALFYSRNAGSSDWSFYPFRFSVHAGSSGRIADRFGFAHNTPVPYELNYDDNFILSLDSLSVFEDNLVRFDMAHAFPNQRIGTTTLTTLFLLKESDITNGSNFIDDYDLMHSELITGSLVSSGTTFDQALISQFSNIDVGTASTTQFNVASSFLEFNAQYRVGFIAYNDTDQKSYSVISQRLTANALPECPPILECYFGNYFEELQSDFITAAVHERIYSRLIIDKNSMDSCFQGHGIDFNFDRDIVYIAMAFSEDIVSIFAPQSASYLNQWAYTNNPTWFNSVNRSPQGGFEDTFQSIDIWGSIRVPDTIDTIGQLTWAIRWQMAFDIRVSDTITERYIVNKYKQIAISDFQTQAEIETYVYSAEGYPAQKTPILNICDTDKIVIEVVKTAPFTDEHELIANIYQQTGSVFGSTNATSIEEEEEITQLTELVQSQSVALLDVDADFGGTDTASFCVDVSELEKGNRYFVDAIIRKK